MKNLLSVLICLFVISVVSATAQYSSVYKRVHVSTGFGESDVDNDSFVGGFSQYGTPVYLYAEATVFVNFINGGKIEARSKGIFYYTGGSNTLDAYVSRTTAGSTYDQREGNFTAKDTDFDIVAISTNAEGSAWASLYIRW